MDHAGLAKLLEKSGYKIKDNRGPGTTGIITRASSALTSGRTTTR